MFHLKLKIMLNLKFINSNIVIKIICNFYPSLVMLICLVWPFRLLLDALGLSHLFFLAAGLLSALTLLMNILYKNKKIPHLFVFVFIFCMSTCLALLLSYFHATYIVPLITNIHLFMNIGDLLNPVDGPSGTQPGNSGVSSGSNQPASNTQQTSSGSKEAPSNSTLVSKNTIYLQNKNSISHYLHKCRSRVIDARNLKHISANRVNLSALDLHLDPEFENFLNEFAHNYSGNDDLVKKVCEKIKKGSNPSGLEIYGQNLEGDKYKSRLNDKFFTELSKYNESKYNK